MLTASQWRRLNDAQDYLAKVNTVMGRKLIAAQGHRYLGTSTAPRETAPHHPVRFITPIAGGFNQPRLRVNG